MWGAEGWCPCGVAVDGVDNVYVAYVAAGSNSVRKFTGDGDLITEWSTQGSGTAFYFVAVDRLGNVYVADRGNNRIQKFRPKAGTLELHVPPSPWPLKTMGQFSAAINGDSAEGWSVTGLVKDPAQKQFPISFKLGNQNSDTFVANFVPDGIAGEWTVDVSAKKGELILAASAAFNVVDRGTITVTIKKNGAPIDNNTVFYDGETVQILLQASNVSPLFCAEVTVYVEGGESEDFVEHWENGPWGDGSSWNWSHSILLPALPVYDAYCEAHYARHTVAVWLGAGKTVAFGNNQDSFVAASSEQPDLVILTNPNGLRDALGGWDSLSTSRLDKILALAPECGKHQDVQGILVYASAYASADEIKRTLRVMQGSHFYFRHLLILGGDDVVPYGKLDDGLGDYPYWDLDGDTKPDVRYSRLPTHTKSAFRNRLYDYLIECLSLRRKDFTEREFPQRALVMSGRDTKDLNWLDTTNPFVNATNLTFLNEHNAAFELFELRQVADIQAYSLLIQQDPVGTSDFINDPCGTIESADVMCFCGHGAHHRIYLYHGSGDQLFLVGAAGHEIAFHVSEDMGASSENYVILSLKTDECLPSNPIVYLSACYTAQNDEYLPAHIMYAGAAACAAYGTSIKILDAAALLRGYMELAVPEHQGRTIGEVHYRMVRDMPPSLWLTNDLKGFIQYGNPRLFLAGGASRSGLSRSHSHSAQPNSISLSLDSYEFVVLPNGKELIRFSAEMEGILQSSSDWILEGNPVLPQLKKELTLPAGQTLGDAAWTSVSTELGEHVLQEAPAHFHGALFENYPLGYPVYMPEPVVIRNYRAPDGRMRVTIEVFPFQYTPSTKSLTMHDAIEINLAYSSRLPRLTS